MTTSTNPKSTDNAASPPDPIRALKAKSVEMPNLLYNIMQSRDGLLHVQFGSSKPTYEIMAAIQGRAPTTAPLTVIDFDFRAVGDNYSVGLFIVASYLATPTNTNQVAIACTLSQEMLTDWGSLVAALNNPAITQITALPRNCLTTGVRIGPGSTPFTPAFQTLLVALDVDGSRGIWVQDATGAFMQHPSFTPVQSGVSFDAVPTTYPKFGNVYLVVVSRDPTKDSALEIWPLSSLYSSVPIDRNTTFIEPITWGNSDKTFYEIFIGGPKAPLMRYTSDGIWDTSIAPQVVLPVDSLHSTSACRPASWWNGFNIPTVYTLNPNGEAFQIGFNGLTEKWSPPVLITRTPQATAFSVPERPFGPNTSLGLSLSDSTLRIVPVTLVDTNGKEGAKAA